MVDATNRPLKISTDYAVYADKHEIFHLMTQLLQSLIINRPYDPLNHLINLLKCKDLDAFTVVILGPPCSGKHSVAELLCRVCPSLTLVDPIPTIRNYLAQEIKKIPKTMRTHPSSKRYRVPPPVAAQAILHYLKQNESLQRSWVMPGFPRNKSQAVELASRGISPEYVIILDVADNKVYARFAKKFPEFKEFLSSHSLRSPGRFTPGGPTTTTTTGTTSSGTPVIRSQRTMLSLTKLMVASQVASPKTSDPPSASGCKTTGLPPPAMTSLPQQTPFLLQKFQKTLLNYRRNAPSLKDFYAKVYHPINGEPRLEIVLNTVVSRLRTRPQTLSPFNPRILLMGPPASGKKTLAASLASKYDLMNLNCGELLRQDAARKAAEDGVSPDALPLSLCVRVSDDYVLSVVAKRLLQVDCVTCGWILRGFPRNMHQADIFQKANFFPNKVIILDVPDKVCLERVLPRRMDPATGVIYHSNDKIPLTPAVIARLVLHPRDCEERVRQRLALFRGYEPSLTAFYEHAQHINGNMPIFNVFEHLESILLHPNPRHLYVSQDIFPKIIPHPLEKVPEDAASDTIENYHQTPLDVDFVDFD